MAAGGHKGNKPLFVAAVAFSMFLLIIWANKGLHDWGFLRIFAKVFY